MSQPSDFLGNSQVLLKMTVTFRLFSRYVDKLRNGVIDEGR